MPSFLLPTLAKASQGEVLLWVGILVVVVVIGGLGILVLRRKLLAKDDGSAYGAGFLEELRAMHRRGEISTEEFEATKRAMTEKLKASLAAKPPATVRAARGS
jgi:hypothetical protein